MRDNDISLGRRRHGRQAHSYVIELCRQRVTEILNVWLFRMICRYFNNIVNTPYEIHQILLKQKSSDYATLKCLAWDYFPCMDTRTCSNILYLNNYVIETGISIKNNVTKLFDKTPESSNKTDWYNVYLSKSKLWVIKLSHFPLYLTGTFRKLKQKSVRVPLKSDYYESQPSRADR